jgi:hypothetical protein
LSDEDRLRWEKRCRYEVSRLGLLLLKSRARNPRHPECGCYRLGMDITEVNLHLDDLIAGGSMEGR